MIYLSNMTDQERIAKLEKELQELKRLFVVTPTMVRVTKSLQIDGAVFGDRIYTQGSGNYTELIS